MKHYALSEFNELVKKVLSKNLDPSYWILAEIGEINIAHKGHCYMELIEKEGEAVKAKLRATAWSYTFSTLHAQFIRVTGVQLKAGMKVLVNAKLEFHELYGMSLNIKDIDPHFTLGDRERKKRETVLQLESEGIIDLNRGLDLPTVPQRIAIISSETAAGYGDFINQFTSNEYGYVADLQLFHSTMQGENAPSSILENLHQIYEMEDEFDAVIVIRGGGAQTDLDCFDDYELCAHLAQFPLPIITGIGHERDQTIADLVAHTHLKTPTAVAEFLLQGMMQFESKVNDAFERIKSKCDHLLVSHGQALLQKMQSIQYIATNKINQANYRLTEISHLLDRKPMEIVRNEKAKMQLTTQLIAAYDPELLLKKGYSIATMNGKLMKNTTLEKGDEMKIVSSKQSVMAIVDEVNENTNQ